MWGVVEDVSPTPEKLESEIVTEIVTVKLDDGRVVKVPEANLEVFPEKGFD
jgi:hypothetical protein